MTFAIAARDELWLAGRCVERRLSHGVAVQHGNVIDATDARDDALVALCDAAMIDLRASAPQEERVRLFASARRVNGTERIESIALPSPAARERDSAQRRVRGGLPLLWRNGSASVLLHEAIGHAAEHGHFTKWPEWLTVHDEPTFPIDDLGTPTKRADLLRQGPHCFRRESFRDVPLRRMTTLIARQQDAPFAMPPNRIEIHTLQGGAYEPLDGTVTLHVIEADIVENDEVHPLAPFTIRRTRDELARSLLGATGEPLRYPGVICSAEGQELIVGSYAPLMVTA